MILICLIIGRYYVCTVNGERKAEGRRDGFCSKIENMEMVWKKRYIQNKKKIIIIVIIINN